PGGNGAERASALPERPASPRLAGPHRDLPDPLLGLGLREGDERQADVHAGVREAVQPGPGARLRGLVRGRPDGGAAGEAGGDGGHPPTEPGTGVSPAAPTPRVGGASPVRLGLRENLGQFALLVVINAFVGAMVGLERTVLPLLGEREFGLA